MKIAIAGGHSKAAQGASDLLNEYDCDRAYVAQLIQALQAAGLSVVNCSNEQATVNGELREEVRLANASGADLFLAVHFNAGGGTGTEAFIYPGSSSAQKAAAMSANVAAALNIRNRGLKTSSGLYVLKNTTMPAIILEVCFVDSQTDYDAWNRTSWEALTSAVVSAVTGSASKPSKGEWVRYEAGWWYRYPDGTWPANAWENIDGKWYWFGSDGYMAYSTCLNIGGKWYAFGPSGAMLTSIQVNSGGDMVL